MKIRFILIALVIIGTVAARGQKLQWKQTNGPNGGYINCLVENTGNIYAGTDGMGIFRASADGGNWTLISEGDITALGFAFHDNAMYAGTLKQGIIRTVDGGGTWTEINSGIPRKIIDKDTSIPAMRALLSRNSMLFVGTFGYGLFRSDNGGELWGKVTALPADNIIALMNDGDAIWAGTNKGVYRSDDNGTTWRAMNVGLPSDAVYGIVKSGTSYFIGTYQSGVYRSSDGGSTWRAINDGLPILQIWSIEAAGSVIYAGTHGNGVYRVSANDTTWTRVEAIGNSDVRAFSYSASNLFVGTFSGIWHSGDDGATWAAVGLPRTVISSLAFNGQSLFAGIFAGGISRSDNGGETWKSVNNGAVRSGTIVQCLLAKNGNVYAGIYGTEGVYRTDNNGAQWKAVNNGLPASTVWSLASFGSDILAGTTEGIYRSSDNGDNWVLLGEGTESMRVLSISVDGQTIYIGSMDGVYKSDDGGATWKPSNEGIEMKHIGALSIHNGIVFAGVIGGGGGVLRSTDAGAIWQTIGNFGDLAVSCFVIRGNAIFAGSNGGVFLSTDNADTWTEVNDGMDFREVNTLALQGSVIYAGTIGGGVYKADIGTTSASEVPCNTKGYAVFADGGGLRLQLDEPQSQDIGFVFSDILGNKICAINIPAGMVSARIDSILYSGVYYCASTSGVQYPARSVLIIR